MRILTATTAALLLFVPIMASATPLAYTGSLTIDMSEGASATFGELSTSISGVADVSSGTVSLAAGSFSIAGLTAPVFGAGADLTRVTISLANGAGLFLSGGAPTNALCSNIPSDPGQIRACVVGGGLGGVMPLIGQLRFDGTAAYTQALTSAGEGVGIFGEVSTVGLLRAGPWTTAKAVASSFYTGVTAEGELVGSIGPGGYLKLVTPIVIDTGNDGPPGPSLTGVARLEMYFVPEPGALILLWLSGLLFTAGRVRLRG